MHTRKGSHTLVKGMIAAVAIASVSVAFAQNAPPPGAGGPGGAGGGGRGGAGGPGGGAPDPQQFVDRLMANDANGDGKLSKDEVPGGFADRLFEQGDADKDGFLSVDEIKAMASRAGQGPGGGRGGQQMGFGTFMNMAGRSMGALEHSKFEASTRDADLAAVSGVQAGLAGAKSRLQSVPMSANAKARFGDDEAAFRASLRKHLFDALTIAMELETAIDQGDRTKAEQCFARLMEAGESGHDLFQPAEDERPAPPPGAGRGGDGGQGGGGGRGGAGGDGGRPGGAAGG